MSHHPSVIERVIEVIKSVGTGSGGTRNISGSTPYHNQLESDLAKFHKRKRDSSSPLPMLQIKQH